MCDLANEGATMKGMFTYDWMEAVRNTNEWLGASARAYSSYPVWGLVPFSPAILRQQKPEPRSGVFRSGIHRESGTNGTIRNRIFPDDETTEPECRLRGAFVSMSRILPVLPRSTHRVGWRSRRQIWHGDITQYVRMFHIMILREQIMARLWLNPGKIARFGLIHSRRPSVGRAP